MTNLGAALAAERARRDQERARAAAKSDAHAPSTTPSR